MCLGVAWLWNVFGDCADKLHQLFQKTNSRHCRVSESNCNYWPPLMVYPKANLWNRKVYTATDFENRATTHTWNTSQGQLNIWNEMWICEWKVSNSVGKGVNKTVHERLQTKLSNGQIEWECVKIAANCTNSACICNKFTNKFKKWNFWLLPF
jgi:hypothetical protein